jgi:hypothetical protein
MSQKKKQKKRKTGLKDVTNETPQTSYLSEVYTVWLNPDYGTPELAGIFSTITHARNWMVGQEDAIRANKMVVSLIPYEVDYRLKQPVVKYLRRTENL